MTFSHVLPFLEKSLRYHERWSLQHATLHKLLTRVLTPRHRQYSSSQSISSMADESHMKYFPLLRLHCPIAELQAGPSRRKRSVIPAVTYPANVPEITTNARATASTADAHKRRAFASAWSAVQATPAPNAACLPRPPELPQPTTTAGKTTAAAVPSRYEDTCRQLCRCSAALVVGTAISAHPPPPPLFRTDPFVPMQHQLCHS